MWWTGIDSGLNLPKQRQPRRPHKSRFVLFNLHDINVWKSEGSSYSRPCDVLTEAIMPWKQ